MRAPDRRNYSPPSLTGELGRSDAIVARNSFQRATSFCDHIDGVKIEDLARKYGSPLFVFSEDTIRTTARRFKKAFAKYPNTVFGWSYKTNYLRAICNVFHQEGWIAEVVSEFEYQKAIKAGIPGKDIIYNGPCKSRQSLELAIKNGSLVQIDNWDELKTIEEIITSGGCGVRVDVGIRLWLDTGLTPAWSKFGFNFSGQR